MSYVAVIKVEAVVAIKLINANALVDAAGVATGISVGDMIDTLKHGESQDSTSSLCLIDVESVDKMKVEAIYDLDATPTKEKSE